MKTFKQYLVMTVILLAASMAFTACGSSSGGDEGGNENTGGGSDAKLTALVMNGANGTSVGTTTQLTATATPADAKVTLTWSSSNATVATVDANGLVEGLKSGVTVISVEGGGQKATKNVKIYDVIVSSLSSDYDKLTAKVGDEVTAYLCSPDDGTQYDIKAQWSVDKSNIVSLSSTEGTTVKFTCKGEGTAVITAKFGKVERIFTVTVLASNPHIYAAGFAKFPGVEDRVATLWKDGTPQSLSNYDGSEVYDMTVSGSDVYAVIREGNKIFKLWKNGKSSNIDSNTLDDIFISGNNIYIAGSVWQGAVPVATVWKDGTPTKICTSLSQARGVFVSGRDVYAAGAINNDKGIPVATMWKNSVATSLSDGNTDAICYAICVSGGNVYAVGYVKNTSGIDVAFMWKNGAATKLGDGTTPSRAYDVCVSGSNVYVAGEKKAPCMWKNGQAIEYGVKGGALNSVCIYGNDVYAAGNVLGYPFVWKNGVPTSYDKNESGTRYTSGNINSIVVVK